MSSDDAAGLITRRELLTQITTGLAAATALGPLTASAAADTAAAPKRAATGKPRSQAPYNIVFIFSDQERYFRNLPAGLSLPAHERLQRTGVTFHNHYCPAVMCTSSRSVLLTGLQTIDNRMFENADLPWMKPLSTDVPTSGHMLRKGGYYTAYRGKWHLNQALDGAAADRPFAQEMEAYGFADYVWPGDILTHPLGGYRFDHMIAVSAISWLRGKGQPMSAAGKPWALCVSLVNPHDIMYFNSDAPGERVQDTGRLLSHAAPAPDHPMFRQDWKMPRPKSQLQAFDEPGRPKAHGEFNRSWAYVYGSMPADDPARWNRFNNYYLNSLRAVDAQLMDVFAELDALGLSERTIIVYTSDHGEMGGAHGLRGKGPFAYEENIHVPFYLVHPEVKGGQDCRALTSHIDVVPTLLSMAGMGRARLGEAAGRDLPGKDISAVLSNPGAAGATVLREATLFTYSGLALNDSALPRALAEAKASGQDVKAALSDSGFRPDLRKRGSVRSTFDGRYKYTRYFAPVQRNRPTTLEEIYLLNDPELFDLQSDPGEMHNLAAIKGQNARLVLAMNTKLNKVIQAEMDRDDGREMPEFAKVSWAAEQLEL
jgi:arylsulfatase A-like enzyme